MLIALGLIIATTHLYFLWALGATFGYDSFIYAQLGEAFFTPGGLQQFYSGPRYYIFQHLAPGLPLLWSGASLLAGAYGWLLFSVIQHALAGVSLLYLLSAVRPLIPGPLLMLAAMAVVCNPLYQSLHSRPMTESVSGSMYLIGLASVVHMLLDRAVSMRPLVLLTLSGAVAVQFRSQAAVHFLLFFAVLILSRPETKKRTVVLGCLLLVVGSALAWPAYRWAATGQGFLPNASYLALAHALRYNSKPSEEVVARLNAFPLPPTLAAERIVRYGLNYSEAAEMGRYLKGMGFNDAVAKREVLSLASAVRSDSSDVVMNQLRLPLLSIGLTGPVFLGSPDRVIHRDYTAQAYAAHMEYWERWYGGTLLEDYRPELDRLLMTFKQSPELYDPSVIERLARSLRPFLTIHSSAIRDPLHLSTIPSDLWIVGWTAALIMLFKSHRLVVGVLLLPVLANYLISLSVPIGTPRYGYHLVPVYVVGFMVSLAKLTAFFQDSKPRLASETS